MNAAFNPSGPRQGSLTRTILLLKGPVLFLSLLSGYVFGRKGMRGKDSGRREKTVQKPAGEIEATFEELLGSKSGTITIDPSTLTRETGVNAGTEPTLPSAAADDALLEWWNGEWYGWWKMTDCSGSYESMEGQWWDICGVIEIDADRTGTVTLWDEDYTKDEAMVSAAVSLSDTGTGEHGTLTSEGGWFTDVALAHADWIVDPDLQELADIICIDGRYENGDDTYRYEIYLRPWGLYWDDVEEENRPYLYADWYLPLIDAGKSMPDSIGADAPAGSGNMGTTIVMEN